MPVLQQHLPVIRHFNAGLRESEADVSLTHNPYTLPSGVEPMDRPDVDAGADRQFLLAPSKK